MAIDKKLIEQLQIEVDAAFLYRQLAAHFKDEPAHTIFNKMSLIEHGHAKRVLSKIQAINPQYEMPNASFGARMQIKIAEYAGYTFIINNLSAVEWKIAKSVVDKKHSTGEAITGYENIHLNILSSLSSQQKINVEGGLLSQFEGKHKSIEGNALRAAVLGANDGLVSNMSLVMGVAGAAQGSSSVLIAGVAGLLAG
jgi:rubrerythrin